MNVYCCCTTHHNSVYASNEIERQIELDRQKQCSTVKLLLLGTGECGKSTFLKQMRILHAGGFSETDREFQRHVIINHIIQSTRSVLEGMRRMNSCSFTLSGLESFAGEFFRLTDTMPFIRSDLHFVEMLRLIWCDHGFREMANDPTNTSRISDNTDYNDYVPTDQDILCARMETCGIVELDLAIKSINLRVVDVGGQRSQRRKWLHCFEGVHAIIFITALSEYNQLLREDVTMNRMKESLRLFANISNSRLFRKTNMLLFLNKTDIFKEKIKSEPISVFFAEYNGEGTDEDSRDHIKNAFLARCSNRGRTMYHHYTCATDTSQVEMVLDVTFDIIVTGALKNTGLLA